MSPVRYDLGSYIPKDGILHSHCPENLTSYIIILDTTLRTMAERFTLYRHSFRIQHHLSDYCEQ
jgi:hypothetical protein